MKTKEYILAYIKSFYMQVVINYKNVWFSCWSYLISAASSWSGKLVLPRVLINKHKSVW